MRTHGHREGNITHRGLLGGGGGEVGKDSSGWEDWQGIALGEIRNVDDSGGRMQQTTMVCVYLCNNPA